MIAVSKLKSVHFSAFRVFEFHAVIPDVKDLIIQVLDNDYGNDDIIGETRVDLENRLLTRRHAIAGLPSTYHMLVIKQYPLSAVERVDHTVQL